MAKCTGIKCPMQVGYKVDECNHKDCLYRTEPITNADRVRAMSDEELAAWAINEAPKIGFRYTSSETGLLKWLKQPAEEDD